MSLRVLHDTNGRIFSLITPKGTCARLLAALQEAGYRQLISAFLPPPHELQDKLAAKFRWPTAPIALALRSTLAMAEFVSPDIVVDTCRDPDDNHVLECAPAGAAGVMVTGDDDLLTLHPRRGIQIFSVRRSWSSTQTSSRTPYHRKR